jgi:O-antigen ligase
MARIQAVVVGLTALILTPGALFYFDVTPKLAVVLIGAAVLCLFPPRPADRLLTIVLLLTLASAALSTILSPNPALSLFGSTWRRYGLVAEAAVLLTAWFVSQTTDRVTVIRGIAIAGALSAVYGISQYFGYDPVLPAAAYHIGEGVWTIVRPPGTLGYVSYFATWLLMCGFLSASLRSRWGYIATALCWTAMLLTGTRAAFLGLAVGLLALGYRRGFRLSRRPLVAAGALVVAAAAFYFSPLGWNLRSRTRWFAEDPWGGARPLLWRDSLRMAGARPAIGQGLETFSATFPHYESKELARAYPDFAHESPHNVFLDALVQQGIPGLLCFAAVCALGFRTRDPWLTGALAAGLAAQQFTVFTIATALIFYCTVALCSPKPERAVVVPRFALAPVAAVLLYCAIRYSAADLSLAQTRRALDAADLQTATTRFADYGRRKFPGGSADLWYARSLLALQAPDSLRRFQAFQLGAIAADRATRTAEEPFNAWLTLATVRAAQNDAAATENALRQAIAAHPNWFKTHWTLAQLLQLQGRRGEAVAEAELAADLNGGKNPEVAATLTQIRASQK